MLILTRKNHESVVVGEPHDPEHLLKITVVEIRGRQVRLGFEVPAAIPVHRMEVWERIRGGVQPGPPPERSRSPAI